MFHQYFYFAWLKYKNCAQILLPVSNPHLLPSPSPCLFHLDHDEADVRSSLQTTFFIARSLYRYVIADSEV